MKLIDVISAMISTPQGNGTDVYDHCKLVANKYFDIKGLLQFGHLSKRYKLPSWFLKYRSEIFDKLAPDYIVSYYASFHDCGKPFCKTIDCEGKVHYPDHAVWSFNTFWSVRNDFDHLNYEEFDRVAFLILNDMAVHTVKNVDEDFANKEDIITLLVVALAEIHANAELFGGIESDGFKIKFAQIERKGKRICKLLFGEK